MKMGSVSLRCFTRLGPLALLLAVAAVARADEPRAGRETATVATNLAAPFFGAYYLEANIRASRALGVLINTCLFPLDNGAFKTRTATVGAGLSYHWQGTALHRWYVEALSEALFSRWRHEPSGETAPIVLGVSGSALVGYRFLFDVGAVLDLGAGATVLHFPRAHVTTTAGPASSAAMTKYYPTLKLNVGWAF